MEELGIEVNAGAHRGAWWGVQPWRRYRINVIEVHAVNPLPSVLTSEAHDSLRWFGPSDEIDAYDWLGPDRDVMLTLVPSP